MKITNYLFLCLGLPLLTLAGCDNDLPGDNFGKDTERYDIPLASKSVEINDKGQAFAFNFYKEMARREKADFCVSPLSANLCLGMVLNGADGDTYKEIQQTLGYEDFTYEEINEYARTMQAELPKLDGRTIFTNANSLWIKNDFPILESFINTSQTYYDAEVRNEPFTNETLSKINNWCANKTNDLIPEILTEISPLKVSYLINALYFKGVWTAEFKKKDTKDEPFYLSGGKEIKVPTMWQENTMLCYIDDHVSAVELPYGNKAFSLVLFMPNSDGDEALSQLIEGLDQTEWNRWLEGMRSSNIQLHLPRFKFQSQEMDLVDVMKAMGIKKAFNELQADFSNMSDMPIYLSILKQKTFIEVNESGTEAAAVTAAGMDLFALSPEPQVTELRFNRPFGYLLKEKSTGAILFAGRVDRPDA